MNIKTTLLSLLTLSTLSAPAMAGYQIDGVHLMDGSDFGKDELVATDMINSLTEMGIPVINGSLNNIDQCIPEDDKRTLGFYAPGPNLMVICTDEIPTWMQMETLTHEVVHVIQDARSGLDNSDLHEGSDKYLYKLVSNMDESKVETIANLYDESDWNVEIEAFYFETQPEAVAQELKTWAF